MENPLRNLIFFSYILCKVEAYCAISVRYVLLVQAVSSSFDIIVSCIKMLKVLKTLPLIFWLTGIDIKTYFCSSSQYSSFFLRDLSSTFYVKRSKKVSNKYKLRIWINEIARVLWKELWNFTKWWQLYT